MKKLLFLSSIATIFFAGCTSDQQVKLLQEQNDILRQQVEQQQQALQEANMKDVQSDTTTSDSYSTDNSINTTNDSYIPVVENNYYESCDIKGNISYNGGEKIYHVPGCASYNATVIDTSKGERWFCSEEDARALGRRKAYNCP